MGSTQFGNFHNFCRDSTLPVCNLFRTQTLTGSQLGGYGFGGCSLTGITLSHGRHLSNLGSILLCGLAILITALLLWRADRKQAAVGRREFQLFLIGYIIVEICEIFTVGGFPLERKVRLVRRRTPAVRIERVNGCRVLPPSILVRSLLLCGSCS